ncbi:hypothetical protein KNE206_36200 [Kitasatospora sp. NE20-6]|uniref:hypothetical protein n=1 Tax=Kitasatospora sp. NE20-6 TaxID=2859066 RepID=UPI0034DBC219
MSLVMVLLVTPLVLAAVLTATAPGHVPRHRGRRDLRPARPAGPAGAARHRQG